MLNRFIILVIELTIVATNEQARARLSLALVPCLIIAHLSIPEAAVPFI